MADRIGKLCDDCQECGKETVIGLLERPVMYMVVGTFASGYIPDKATLPRFAWEIFADYHEGTDCLMQRDLTRAELCGSCWIARLSKPQALEELTGAQYCTERKAAYAVANPPPAEPEPTPPKDEGGVVEDSPSLNSPIQAEREAAAAALQAERKGGENGS